MAFRRGVYKEGLKRHEAGKTASDERQVAYSRQAVKQTNLVNTVMLDGTMEAYRKGIYAASDILRQ